MPETRKLASRHEMVISKRHILAGILLFVGLFLSASLGSAQYCASNQSPQVTGFSVNPSSVVGDSTQLITGTVTLSCAPLSDTNPYLSSSAPDIIASGYGPDMYGRTSASFGFRAGKLAVPTAVTLTASLSGPGASATVEVYPLTPKLTLGDTEVIGGSSNPQPTINVTWNAPILNSNELLLSTSDNGQYVHLPQAVNLGNGQTSLTIPAPNSSYFFTTAVPGPGPVSVTITGTLDDDSSSVNLLIYPSNGGPNGSDSGPCSQCAAQAAAPINLTNGNVWIQQHDYSLPGLGGGVDLTRTWNSDWQDIHPVSLTGMFGHSWRSNYEERFTFPDSNTVKYWRGDGSAWTFSYAGNSVYNLASPPDQRAQIVYNSGTSQYTLTLADGSEKLFNFNGYLMALVDRNGNQTTVTYDNSNRLTQVTDAAGRSITFTYTDPNNVNQATSVQDSVGVIARYTYDSSARLTQVTYADNSTLNFAYDPSSSMITSVTDGQGKVLEAHTYDSLHRGLTSARAGGVDQVTVSYPSFGQTQLSDSMGNNTAYGYQYIGGHFYINSVNGPGCSSCGGRGLNTFSFDSLGNRTSSTDALGRTTNFSYDSQGNVLSRSIQLNSNTTLTWSYTYNAFNEVLTTTDPAGNVTTNTYDAKGNLLSTTTPSPDGTSPGSVTAYSYDSKGEPLTVTDPLGNKTTLAYTPAGLVASITDAQNNATTFQYDARGNRTSVTDALGHQTTYSYDAMSRLTQITQPGGVTTSFGYDYRGRRTSVTDPDGKATTYAYDDADHLLSVTDAASHSTDYGYDTENHLASITDALGRVTSFTYDTLGRVTQVSFPSSLAESYTYDAVGNLISKTDRKDQTITYTYDNLDRLTSKTYPDSTAVNYTYDNLSRLTQVTDPTGTYRLLMTRWAG